MEFNANDQDDSGNSRNPEQQQNRANQNMDPNNPIYLHHSDHPHYVLTTHVLNDRNYHRWKRSVEVSLNAKNKFVFVTGVCKEPVGDPSLAMQWKRCDSMVIAWLTHSVEKDIADTLLYCNTSAEIWNDLKTRFGHPNSSRIYQVQKDLFNVAQENLSITQYFTKFRKFWDEYMVLVDMPKCNSCGTLNPMPQFLVKQQIIQFLVGLNDSYNTVRGSILMIKPTPTIAEVYHMVLEEEKQRELNNASNVSNDSAAFNAYSRNGKNHSSNGYNGGNNNSNSNSGYSRSKGNENVNSSSNFGSSSSNNRNEKEKPVYFCDHCKITGHSISRCFKINGYPPRNDKGKKFAGNACENEERSDKGDKGSHNQEKTPAFTKDQYERLMALLSKQNTADDHGASMMAGPFNEHITGSW